MKDDSRVPRVVLRCERPLPQGARVELLWGRDVAAITGTSSIRDQQLVYAVREVFRANVHCSNRQGMLGCDPAAQVYVSFNAPVPRRFAEQVSIVLADGTTRKADTGLGPLDEITTGIGFRGPFAERSTVTLRLPARLTDDSGRSLTNASSFPWQLEMGEPTPIVAITPGSGVIEHHRDAALRVTLQNVEPELNARLRHLDGATGNDRAIIESLKLFAAGRGRDRIVFERRTDVRTLPVTTKRGGTALETVSIPLATPGHYLIEIESSKMASVMRGQFHRASVLVTNLAVH